MRAKTLLLLACAAPLTAFAQTAQRGTIDFELDELKTDTLLVGSCLVSDLGYRNLRLDTIMPGQTRYTYMAETDTIAYKVFITPGEEKSKAIVLVLLPGEQFKVTGSMRDWRVEGSGLNAAYAPIQKACRPYRERMEAMEHVMTEKLYNEEYLPTWHQMDSLQAAYVRQYPDSDLSLFILGNIESERMDKLYLTLTERVKKGAIVSHRASV